MLIGILIAVGLLAVLFTVAAFLPKTFLVSRSVAIAAPAKAGFELVNDLHRWPRWSPFENKDPKMERTYGELPAGAGATFSWSGNAVAGKGRVTIVESRPPDLIRIKLEMYKPFAATNAIEFTFVPQGGQTIATLTMTGTKNFAARIMCIFISMDRMVGGDFEAGLASLKKLAENPASP